MSFTSDLKEGEEYEKKIILHMILEFGIDLEKNVDKKAIDLIHPLMKMEVKYDKGSIRTGNYFLEFECNKNKGGILKEDLESHECPIFFGIGNENEFLIFHINHLQRIFYEWYGDEKYRVVENAGDGGRVRGMLVPCIDLKQHALYIINLK